MLTSQAQMLKGTPATSLYLHLSKSSFRNMTLCDIDGVLVDSKSCTISLYEQALATLGIRKTPSEIEAAVWGNTWEQAATILGLDEHLAYRVHEAKLALPVTHKPKWNIVNYVKTLLPHVTIITSGSEKSSNEKLLACDLDVTCFYSCDKTSVQWWLNAIPNNCKCDIIDDSWMVLRAADVVDVKPRRLPEGCTLR